MYLNNYNYSTENLNALKLENNQYTGTSLIL